MANKKLILLAKTYEAGRNWVDANATKYHDPYSHSWFVCYTHHDLEKYLNTIAESKDVSGYITKDAAQNPEFKQMMDEIYRHKQKLYMEQTGDPTQKGFTTISWQNYWLIFRMLIHENRNF